RGHRLRVRPRQGAADRRPRDLFPGQGQHLRVHDRLEPGGGDGGAVDGGRDRGIAADVRRRLRGRSGPEVGEEEERYAAAEQEDAEEVVASFPRSAWERKSRTLRVPPRAWTACSRRPPRDVPEELRVCSVRRGGSLAFVRSQA